MGAPILWGPNNLAKNLENGIVHADGAVSHFDGAFNYLPGGSFETGLYGAPYATISVVSAGQPAATPTLSSTPNSLTVAIETTAPLRGSQSMRITAPSAWAQGDAICFGPSFKINPADAGKVLAFSCTYQVTSGAANLNFSGIAGSQNLALGIFDLNAFKWVGLAGSLGINQSVSTGIVQATFQASVVANQQYQAFLINVGAASAGSCSILVDEVFVGPQKIVNGTPVTDWVNSGATVIGAITTAPTKGTIVKDAYYWRRNGGNVEIRIEYQQSAAGSNGSGAYLYSMPPGLSADLTKASIVTTGGQSNVIGTCTASDGTNGGFGVALLYSSTQFRLLLNTTSGTTQAFQNASAGYWGLGSTATVSFAAYVSIPVSGWSSNVQMSSDTDTRVCAALYSTLTSATVTAGTPLAFTTQITDTHGAFSGGNTFRAPISGIYNVGLYGLYSSSGSDVSIYVNGVNKYPALWSITTVRNNGALPIPLNAGDAVTLVPASSCTLTAAGAGAATNGAASFTRISGPSVVAATDSINCRYMGSTTTISSTLATIAWSARDYDTHGAMAATGIYTCPAPGKYQVNCNIQASGGIALNGTLDLQLQKNSVTTSDFQTFAGGAVTAQNAQLSDIIQCLAGDQLRLQLSSSSSNPAVVSSNVKNFVSIARVGN